jgi:hypothetical protein
MGGRCESPHVLANVTGTINPSPLTWLDLLERWPTLEQLQRAHPGTLRKFFQQSNCRSQETNAERIAAIQQSDLRHPRPGGAGSMRSDNAQPGLPCWRRSLCNSLSGIATNQARFPCLSPVELGSRSRLQPIVAATVGRQAAPVEEFAL